MSRPVQLHYDEQTNTLSVIAPRQDGTGNDVLWSTTDTTPPSPWIVPDE